MKRLVSLGLAIALALAMNSDAPQSQARASVAQAVMDRTASGDEVPIIVAVAARFVPEGNLAADALAAQRASMTQVLDDTMARAAAVGVPVGRRFDSIPYFTARVNRAQLEALATTAGVTSIYEDVRTTPSLNVSTGLIEAPAAWAGGHTGTGWSVAVLDSGVDKTHSFLSGKVVSEACYSDANGLGGGNSTTVCPGGVFQSTAVGSGVNCSATIEGCDHGTHVAGIAAGANGPGGANGVAPGASVVAIQVFTRFDGAGSGGCGSTAGPCISAFNSDIIRGLERVLALKNAGGALSQIAAVNMSLGSFPQGDATCDASNAPTKAAIDNLLAVGIPSVIASGNDAIGGAISAPGCISTAVAVGATTKGVCPGSPGCPAGAPAGLPNVPDFSNHSAAVELLAPGVGINSSVLGGLFSPFDGTSMATPHVAGAWAILKQAVPGATPAQVLAALAGTGQSIFEPFTGIPKPLIKVNAARLALIGTPPPVGVPGAPTSFIATVSGNFLSMTWGAPVSGGAPTGYTLRARSTPTGAPIVNFALGNTLAFGLNAPNGVYYLSVYATNAAGSGPESSVVPVTIPALPPPPGAPTNLQANLVGNNVTFTFTPPASGGAVANFLLVAGLTPGFAAPLASMPLAPSQTTFGVAGVPPGTWYVRVVAQNAGGTSAPTNEVSFTVAGPTPPGAPTLNPAVVVGNTVSLSWAAGAGGAPTSYTLFAAASPGGTPFLSAPVGGGTSIAFGGVPSGTYFVRLLANNALGSSPPSNEIRVVVP